MRTQILVTIEGDIVEIRAGDRVWNKCYTDIWESFTINVEDVDAFAEHLGLRKPIETALKGCNDHTVTLLEGQLRNSIARNKALTKANFDLEKSNNDLKGINGALERVNERLRDEFSKALTKIRDINQITRS